MLGTRTKQVFAYGKRQQRIVNVSDDRDKTDPFSVLNKSPSVTRKLKMRKRVTPRKLPSKAGPNIDHATPTRTPLSSFPVNIPGSLTKKTNDRSVKTIELDIIVLDQHGKKISQERRVSHTGVKTPQNSASVGDSESKTREGKRSNDGRKPDTVHSLDSDDEAVLASQPKPARRLYKSAKAVVLSDDSDSDTEVGVSVYKTLPEPERGSAKPPLPPKQPRGRVEVVIPRPPTTTRDYPPPAIVSKTNASQVPACSPIRRHPYDAQSKEPRRTVQTSPTLPIRYQDLPSPSHRPRQLTPIRGPSGSRIFEPPTPTTPTDFDLSFQLSNIHIDLLEGSDPVHILTSIHIQPEAPPEYLLPLLTECSQEICGPHEFSAFIEMFPLDPIVREAGSDSTRVQAFQKIGEASYSEVFGIGDVVLKIIPLRDEVPRDEHEKRPTPTQALDRSKPDVRYGNVSWNAEKETVIKEEPPPSDAKDVLKEIIVTQAMGEMCEGFVKLLRAYVVRGRYPEVLLKLWDDYLEQRGSESIRPDTFGVSQVYAIIVLPNGGPDLESYSFTSANRYGWRQACSLFWQVTRSLSQAEQLVSFEHRDLHWGQILVKDVPSTNLMPLKPKTLSQVPQHVEIDRPIYGVKATLIDLGLSRMDAGDGAGGVKVHWTPFADEIFMGEGDYQYDIYRMMKEHTRDAWEEFKPLTNIMWLHYLVLKLLQSKCLKPPSASRKVPSRPPPAFSTEKQCYDCLIEIETVLSTAIQAFIPKVPPNRRGRRKTQALVRPQTTYRGPQSASDIVGYALKRGWLL